MTLSVTFKLTPEFWNMARTVELARNDTKIAETYRARHAADVAHLTDDALVAAIAEAREAAFSLGLADKDLRARFIMLAVLRVPRFWQEETVARILSAPTGTPDIRFGDVCALFKRAAERAGTPERVWW